VQLRIGVTRRAQERGLGDEERRALPHRRIERRVESCLESRKGEHGVRPLAGSAGMRATAAAQRQHSDRSDDERASDQAPEQQAGPVAARVQAP